MNFHSPNNPPKRRHCDEEGCDELAVFLDGDNENAHCGDHYLERLGAVVGEEDRLSEK